MQNWCCSRGGLRGSMAFICGCIVVRFRCPFHLVLRDMQSLTRGNVLVARADCVRLSFCELNWSRVWRTIAQFTMCQPVQLFWREQIVSCKRCRVDGTICFFCCGVSSVFSWTGLRCCNFGVFACDAIHCSWDDCVFLLVSRGVHWIKLGWGCGLILGDGVGVSCCIWLVDWLLKLKGVKRTMCMNDMYVRGSLVCFVQHCSFYFQIGNLPMTSRSC